MRRILLVVGVALACAAPAWAHRAPTPKEKQAIEFTVRFFPAMGRGNKLVFGKELVSTVDARYARADVSVSDAKGNPIGKPTTLLFHGRGGWRVVFLGTDTPPCAVAPAKVRLDLLGTKTCA